jgi:hypothetical protein
VPVPGALAKLPEFGGLENGKPYTEKDTEILVQGGQSVSKLVISGSGFKGDKTTVNIGESHVLSPLVTVSHGKSNWRREGDSNPTISRQ